MRLISYRFATLLGSSDRVGAVMSNGRVLDLCLASELHLTRRHGLDRMRARAIAEALSPSRMLDFVANGDVALDQARVVTEWAEASGDGSEAWDLDSNATPLPVLPDAPLIRDFMAFEEHLKNIYPRLGREIPPAWYELPVYYKGNPASAGAHGETVCIPSYCEQFDFEFELAAVIGRGGADISPENAIEHVYGYMIYNDFSARDIQAREMSVGLGPAKGKDFHKAHVFGPALVTRDEIEDVYALAMTASVNGETWCESSTATMHWRFEDMIAHASRDETLRIGEIFGSGTVGGGSAAEKGLAISRGDVLRLTVDGLGTLENKVA